MTAGGSWPVISAGGGCWRGEPQPACGFWGRGWGSSWPAQSHAHLPAPTPAAQVGWVQPLGQVGTSLSVLPTAGTQGPPLPPLPSPQSFRGVHGVLIYRCPHARLSSMPGLRSQPWMRQLLPGAQSAPDALLGELGSSH